MNLRSDLDLYFRALADEWFLANGIALGTERPTVGTAKDTITAFVQSQILTASTTNGRSGAGVLVLMPTGNGKVERAEGPPLDIVVTALVMESYALNYGTNGTGKTAEEILLRWLQIQNNYMPADYLKQRFHAPAGVIGALPAEFTERGLVGYSCSMVCPIIVAPVTKVATPTVAITGTTLPKTVTITAAAGATVYYTTNLSAPFSSNSAASPYNGAFQVGAACTLRFAAEKTGYAPSNAEMKEIT